MKKVIITGGAGFIGSHLAEKLYSQNKEVMIIDNFDDFYSPEIKERNIHELAKKTDFQIVKGDICHFYLFKEAVKKFSPEVVIHLAAKTSVRPSVENPLLYQKVNVLGTNTVLEVLREEGIKNFVFASSSSVYGDCPKTPFSEDDPQANPISPYGATKKAGEAICYSYCRLYGINTLCLRFFTVYGPRQRPEMAIHKFTRHIDEGEEIKVFDAGKIVEIIRI